MLAFQFTLKSSNKKTGPIPVTSSPRQTCPDECPLKNNGCYADNSHMGVMWRKLSEAYAGDSFSHGRATVKTVSWDELCERVAALPNDQLWRHDQMGDLPKDKDGDIDAIRTAQLIKANCGKRGFTYTHYNPFKPQNAVVIARANAEGFTINLSANSPLHADKLAELQIAPVVTVLPESDHGKKQVRTPQGRKVTVCPATYRDDVTCKSCGLCAIANRETIVGFPVHGATRKKAGNVVRESNHA